MRRSQADHSQSMWAQCCTKHMQVICMYPLHYLHWKDCPGTRCYVCIRQWILSTKCTMHSKWTQTVNGLQQNYPSHGIETLQYTSCSYSCSLHKHSWMCDSLCRWWTTIWMGGLTITERVGCASISMYVTVVWGPSVHNIALSSSTLHGKPYCWPMCTALAMHSLPCIELLPSIGMPYAPMWHVCAFTST